MTTTTTTTVKPMTSPSAINKTLLPNVNEEDNSDDDVHVSKRGGLLSLLKERLGLETLFKEPLTCKKTAGFMLPMEYLDVSQVQTLSSTVSTDLEMDAMMKCLYSGEEDNVFAQEIAEESLKKYTTNKEYLKQTQEMIVATGLSQCKGDSQCKDETKLGKEGVDRFCEIWHDIKEDAQFLEKHGFMEWKTMEDLNKSAMFLQLYSMFNIISPVFSLLMPIFLLLLPFLLIKLQGITITLEQYVVTLKEIAQSHFLGKALSIQNFSVESVLYFLFICGMYALQTYQNVTACMRYYRCMKRMNENLCALRSYVMKSIRNMDAYVFANRHRSYYSDFCQDVWSHKLVLEDIYSMIGTTIEPFCHHPKKLMETGHMLHCYYQLYSDMDMEESLRYSAGFDGFLTIVRGIYKNHTANHLGLCQFVDEVADLQENDAQVVIDEETEDIVGSIVDEILENVHDLVIKDNEANNDNETNENKKVKPLVIHDKKKMVEFKGQYYAAHCCNVATNETALRVPKRVPNDVSLTSSNIILTGVNASGKTTTLKSTAINILFTQQWGMGFYASSRMAAPFHHIHSYLNIPDTSGRDSLFQAESRRCKEIIDKIKTENTLHRHFCLFDELYSGTNPKEATKSAISLLKYLGGKDNVRFMLTTHYVDVCTELDTVDRMANWQMEVQLSDDKTIQEYSYRMIPGISILEGGIEILKSMDYPEEILDDILGQQ